MTQAGVTTDARALTHAPPRRLHVADPTTDSASIGGASEDPVKDYLQKIGRFPLLTAGEESELARQIEAGVIAMEYLDTHTGLPDDLAADLTILVREGEAAYQRFVRANLRLVVNVAKRYIGHGVPFIDLIQEGNIGLDRAVKKFDYRHGYKFSTYAMWWIRQSVSRCISDSGRLIRVPVHTEEKITVLRRVSREFEVDHGRRPTVDELVEATGYPGVKIHDYLEADREPMSINAQTGDDTGSEFGDLIEDDDYAPVVDIVTTTLRHDLLYEKLNLLPARDAEILRLRYGLTAHGPLTFEQVGEIFGVSRERVRQIEKRALAKLRCEELDDGEVSG